jgi:glycosyltransferase involved in cell wall biosynthesis
MISIAMTVYNGENFLADQLISLNEQSVLPAEIVITDDGSSDETPKIIEEFGSVSKIPVKYFRNETRLGWRKNFLKATSLCQHDLIALCDQDDIWLPEKLQICQRYFHDPAILAVHHNLRLIDADRSVRGMAWGDDAYPAVTPPLGRNLLWDNPGGLAMIFRRKLCDFDPYWSHSFDKFFIGEPAAHDQWYFSLAALLGTTIYDKSPLVEYRQHGSNTVGLNNSSMSDRLKGKDPYVAEMENNLNVVRGWIKVLELGEADLPAFADRARLARLALIKQAEFLSQQLESILETNIFRKFRNVARTGLSGGYSTSNFGLGRRAAIKALWKLR